jgi:4-hydroxy-tetrahydrodipicolinate synthase
MFSGVLSALVTPFISNEDTEIDWNSFDDLLEWQLSSGVHGLVLYGTTGESATLSTLEKIEILKRAKAIVKGRVPLIIGAGTNSTNGTLEFIEEVKDLKPEALLAVAPYYNKPSQEGMYRHFEKIAIDGGLPLVLYNVPSRTVVEISVETLIRLANVKNIVALKQATDSVSNLTELGLKISNKISLLAGDDPVFLYTMLMGGKGIISASAGVLPLEFVSLYNACINKEWEAASKIQKDLSPLIQSLFIETNPCPAKAVLMKKGIIKSDAVRLPLVSVSDKTREILDSVFS